MNLKAFFEAEFEWINRLSEEDPCLGISGWLSHTGGLGSVV